VIVGLPGAGISTLFYLVCVLLMPLHTLYLMARGRPLRAGHWRILGRQVVIALGVVGMLVAMAVVLSVLLATSGLEEPSLEEPSDGWAEILRTLGRLGTVVAGVTLVIVLGSIKLLSILTRPSPDAGDVSPGPTAMDPAPPSPSQD
jgi:hypothetical protein